MAGYVRQSKADIQKDKFISSAAFNKEFDALEGAFNSTTGHKHDGTIGNGPKLDINVSTTGVLPQNRVNVDFSAYVKGPASTASGMIAVFDGTSGKILMNGGRSVASVLDRSNHTGTQTISTISGLSTELNKFVNKAGDTMTGLLTTRSDSDNRILIPGQGIHPNIEINYSSSGNLGFYDRTNSEWVFRIDYPNRTIHWKGGILAGGDGNINGTIWNSLFGGSGGWAAQAIKNYIDGKNWDASRVNSGRLRVAQIPHMQGGDSDGYVRITNTVAGDSSTLGGINLDTTGNFWYSFNGTRKFQVTSEGNVNIEGHFTASSNSNINLRNANWVDVPTPTGANQAANKAYVDSRPAWPGAYTGTARDNTNFPVGTILGGISGSVDRASTVTLRLETSRDFTYRFSGSGAILAGSWRSRGVTGETGAGLFAIAQRVS